MGPFASGIGLLILVVVLLFTWLAVATFVSPELAAGMGLLVVGLWVALFVPMSLVRELVWRFRQQKIITSAMTAGGGMPLPYQAGSALPGPGMSGGAIGGGSSGSLVVLDNPASAGGAIDLYRDLPQLPRLEPRPHASAFKRSLILPFVGLFMFFGAQNEALIHALLEARGVTQKIPIDWVRIRLPNEYADYQKGMELAARMTLRREPACGGIIGGRLAAKRQFTSALDQKEQIANEEFVYELDCAGNGGETSPPYLAWVTPDDLKRNSFTTLLHSFTGPPREAEALTACEQAANAALAPLQSRVQVLIKPVLHSARMPYPEFLRLHGNYSLIRADGSRNLIGLSCWLGRETPAQVRFSRPAKTVYP